MIGSVDPEASYQALGTGASHGSGTVRVDRQDRPIANAFYAQGKLHLDLMPLDNSTNEIAAANRRGNAPKATQTLAEPSTPAIGKAGPPTSFVSTQADRLLRADFWPSANNATPASARPDNSQAAGTDAQAEFTVRRGDTLSDILDDAGLDRQEVHDAVQALKDVFDPRELRVGQVIAIATTDVDGRSKLQGLSTSIDHENDLQLRRSDNGSFSAEKRSKVFSTRRERVTGKIDTSLYLSAQSASVPQDTLLDLIRLYSWDVDFQRDIHPGDAFDLYFELHVSEDRSATKAGDIIFAELTSGGEPLRAYRFKTEDGEVGYFDPVGHSLKKSLMRTPIDGARLSSRFGKRKHPILGYTRMHKGVDFAAPRGTPVYAAGDGSVTSLGRNGGYGKYIRIRHNGTYSTAYAHLNNYAKGVKKDSRVKQGQVIGYVGSTGRSTGPHLHYEILKDGAAINPLAVKQVVAERLKGAELERFERMRKEIDRKIAHWNDATLVAQSQ